MQTQVMLILVGVDRPYSIKFCIQPLSHLMVTCYMARGGITKLKTREFTSALGVESELFCTWRSGCVSVVRVHSMVYGVDDGVRCVLITHMA